MDECGGNHRTVVHTTKSKIDHTSTLFLPQPLIDLVLYCTRKAPGQ
jgi:hypothetical protein